MREVSSLLCGAERDGLEEDGEGRVSERSEKATAATQKDHGIPRSTCCGSGHCKEGSISGCL